MNSSKPFLHLLLMSISIILLLTFMSHLEPAYQAVSDHNRELAMKNRSQILNDHNVVDILTAIPLQMAISSIEWTAPILSIDLKANETVDAAGIYRDLYRMVQHGLWKTTNVDQLLIRVMAVPSRDANGQLLMLAMNAERNQLGNLESNMELNDQEIKLYLRSRFGFNYTAIWYRQFDE